jgi:hypothetical protein
MLGNHQKSPTWQSRLPLWPESPTARVRLTPSPPSPLRPFAPTWQSRLPLWPESPTARVRLTPSPPSPSFAPLARIANRSCQADPFASSLLFGLAPRAEMGRERETEAQHHSSEASCETSVQLSGNLRRGCFGSTNSTNNSWSLRSACVSRTSIMLLSSVQITSLPI